MSKVTSTPKANSSALLTASAAAARDHQRTERQDRGHQEADENALVLMSGEPQEHREHERNSRRQQDKEFRAGNLPGRDAARGSGPIEGLSGLHAWPHSGLDTATLAHVVQNLHNICIVCVREFVERFRCSRLRFTNPSLSSAAEWAHGDW